MGALLDVIKSGESVSYFDNKNTPSTRRRVSVQLTNYYEKNNRNVYFTVKQIKEYLYGQFERTKSFYEGYGQSREAALIKARKKVDKRFKDAVQSIAWIHEQRTGERIEQIPSLQTIRNSSITRLH